MKRRHLGTIAIVAAVVAGSVPLPLCVWLGVLRLEVPGQHWFFHDPQSPRPFLLLPLAALGLLLVALARALSGQTRQRAGMALLTAVLASYLMAIGVRSSAMSGFVTLAMTVVAEGSNSYYLTAIESPDPLALARDYPHQMPHLLLHASTQSPGAMLLHAGLHRLFVRSPAALASAETLFVVHPCYRATDVVALVGPLMGRHIRPDDLEAALLIALLFPLALALGVLPLYGLARRLGGERPALVLVGLYAVTPSFIWYTASLDQLCIPAALLVAFLGLTGVREGKWGRLVGAGVITGATVFVSLGFALMAGVTVLFATALACHRARRVTLGAAAPALVYLAGAAVALTALCLGFGVDLPAVLAASAGLRRELYHNLRRGYVTWLLLNPVEFGMGLGMAGVTLTVAALVLWRRLSRPAVALLGALVVALVGLALLGQVRGETSRMLMFVMPLLTAAGAPVLRRLRLDRVAPALALIVAQAAYAIVCYHLFDVWGDWIEPFR